MEYAKHNKMKEGRGEIGDGAGLEQDQGVRELKQESDPHIRAIVWDRGKSI